jgi:hypothetical protein
MRPYIVRQGDYVTKLGHTMGFDAKTVWNHPKNKDLKERRVEMDMLHPGDLLWIPEPEYRRLSLKAKSTNRYAAAIPKKPVSVRLEVGREPLKKEPYVMLGVGPDPVEGASDDNGWIKTEVEVHTREIEVILPKRGRTLRVRVGDLDPIDTVSGLRKRLFHLGFYQPTRVGVENQDATDGDALVAALKSFQSSKKLPATGKLDDDTRKALIAAHGS